MSDDRRKILYVTPFPEMDKGGQVSLYHLIKGLDKDMYEPILVVPSEKEFALKVRSLGHDVHIRSFSQVKPGNIRKIIRNAAWLGRLIREERIDIIHTDHPKDTFNAVIASFFTRIPVVWHVRVTKPNIPLDMFNKLFVKRIIGVSKATAYRFKGLLLSAGKFVCVYNGVDFSLFDTGEENWNILKEKIGFRRDSLLIFSAAQLVRSKGIDEIIEAASIVLKEMPQACFAIAGEGTPTDKKRLEKKISRLGIKSSFKLLGYRSDVPKLLDVSDIAVLASHDNFEGCPRMVLEAMAARKPVVATNVKGTEEIVSDEFGILVPEKDPEALAEAILELLHDGARRDSMGRAAREIAEKKFDIDRHVEQIQKIYEEIIES